MRGEIRQIYIFRHGETDWNREGRFQGHEDIPLNDRGRDQAKDLVAPLEKLNIQAVLSSDLSRAFETGSIVAQTLGVPIHRDPRVREAYLGKAQGMNRREMIESFGRSTVQGWRSNEVTDADVRFPEGESGNEILDRVFECLNEFLKAHPYERIGLATHGGVIRRIAHRLMRNTRRFVPIPNGVLYEVRASLSSCEEISYDFPSSIEISSSAPKSN